jgi:hypothetical protein
MLSLGVLGTAKNTGKTTTLNALLKCLSKKLLALTSIGFDGEDLDHITGLPKPKVFVEEGSFVVTSEEAAKHSTARLHLLRRFDIRTALGSICLYRVRGSGTVVLVGPYSSEDLLTIKEVLEKDMVEVFLIDGAINRIVPFQHSDFVILAVGASRSTNLDFLLSETRVIVKALRLPIDGRDRRIVEGLVSLEKLSSLRGEHILVESPMHILLTDELTKLEQLLNETDVAVMRKPELLCVTVNPCYLERRMEGYALARIDLSELSKAIERELEVPCLNVTQEEERLCKIVEEKIDRAS